MSTDLNTQRDSAQLVFKALLPIFSYIKYCPVATYILQGCANKLGGVCAMEASNGIGMYNVAKGAMEVKYTMEEHN